MKLERFTDDFQMLYAWYKCSKNILSEKVCRQFIMQEAFNNIELYKPYVGNKKNRNSNVVKAITKELAKQKIKLNQSDILRLKKVSKYIFKRLDSGHSYKNYNYRKVIKNRIKEAFVYLLTNGKIGKRKLTKNREYNPITNLPRTFRPLIPVKYLEIDLSSANAQVVDAILGTNIAMDVYENLMNRRCITRSEAKVLYNSTLNNHFLNITEAMDVYIDAGYTKTAAKKLAIITANSEQGTFYNRMTEVENDMVNTYKRLLSIKTYKFHDAIIMRWSDVQANHISLPTELITNNREENEVDVCNNHLPKMNKINFHIGYYNIPGKSYNGAIIQEPHNVDKGLVAYQYVNTERKGITLDKIAS